MYRIIVLLAAAVSVLPGALRAQSIQAKLGGDTSAETFTIINGSGDSVVVFRADGTAGIGVTDPQEMLEVGGTVKAGSFEGTFVLDTAAVSGNMLSFDGTNWVAKNLVVGSAGSGSAVNNMQPYLGLYHCIAMEGIFPSRSSMNPFIGEIMTVGFSFAPRGWYLCDGQIISIAQYTALFALIGTTYGGDGRTTFGLPDLRGRVAIHPGYGPGLAPVTWGQKSGTNYNYLNTSQLPGHTHTVTTQ